MVNLTYFTSRHTFHRY